MFYTIHLWAVTKRVIGNFGTTSSKKNDPMTNWWWTIPDDLPIMLENAKVEIQMSLLLIKVVYWMSVQFFFCKAYPSENF